MSRIRKFAAIALAYVLLLATWPPPAKAAIAHVFSVANFAGSGATVTTATHAAGATNNLYVVMCSANGTGNTMSITTSGSAFTWHQISTTQSGQGENWSIHWALATDTTTRTFTCSGSGGSGFAGIKLSEFSGTDLTTPVGASAGVDFAFANAASGSITVNIAPAATGMTIWAGSDDNISALGSGYSAGGNDANGDRSEYKLNVSTGSQAVGFTGSGAWVLAVMAINPPGAGVAGCKNGTILLGAGC